jgi:putative membrane protein insertion efficiency factor
MKWLLIFPIKLYQWLTFWAPPVCRYDPSCSDYALQAIHEWGFFKGGWMGFTRILRCNPWGGSGADPVPRRDGANPPGPDSSDPDMSAED